MEQLTSEQRQKVQDWISEKAPLIGKCPICAQRQWILGDQLVQPIPFSSRGNITIGGSAIPMAVLFCGNCGNVQFQSAMIMGLISEKAELPRD